VLLLLASIAGAVSPAAVAGAVADPVGEGTESVAGNTEPAAASVAPTVENAADALDGADGDPDRPQVDAENLTFRTLSTPIGVATRVESGSRGANLGSSVGFAVGETDAAMETRGGRPADRGRRDERGTTAPDPRGDQPRRA